MKSSDRPNNRNSDRRTSLTAMARAAHRTSPSATATPDSPKSRVGARSRSWERLPQTGREELPAPYDDASGFIDLDKLREAASAQPAATSPSPRSRPLPSTSFPPANFPPPPPVSSPLSPPAYQARTAPPVAATIPFAAPPPKAGVVFGMLVGSAIAAVGLVGGYFIASGNHGRDVGGAAARQQPMALNAVSPPPGTAATGPAAGAPSPGAPSTAVPGVATVQAAALLPAATAQAAAASPTATGYPPPAPAAMLVAGLDAHPVAGEGLAAANPAVVAGVRDLGTIEPGDSPGAGGSKEKRARPKPRVAARRAKSDGSADTKTEPQPSAAFLKTLQKSAEGNEPPPAAGPAAALPPAPPAAPAHAAPAPPRSPLAAAIQKASGVGQAEAAPAPAAPPPPPAPAAPAAGGASLTGIPDAPSQGAVRAALAAQIGAAKICVQDHDSPSRANLTYGPDGRVKSITVSGPAAGTPAEECIRSALQKTYVGPFSRPTFVVGLPLRP